jgi:hypothetical protein
MAPFQPKAINGGSVVYSPAGNFINDDGKVVEYEERVKIDYMGKIFKISPAALAAVYSTIRSEKDLADFLGVKQGVL